MSGKSKLKLKPEAEGNWGESTQKAALMASFQKIEIKGIKAHFFMLLH